MNLIASCIKRFINLFSSIIRKNKDVLKYLFTVSLKNEIIDFYDNEFLKGYTHIDKTIITAKKICKGNFIIVDVGGADGTTGKIFSKNFPENEIWIFEPLQENYLQIENLKTQFHNFNLFPNALGSKHEKSIINKADRITSSSIFNLNPDSKSEIFSEILEKRGEEEIEITTLDIIIPADKTIGILKIDVQGYELEVLKGGDQSLKRTNLIVLELNNHNGYVGAPKYYEVDNYLRNCAFTLYDIFPSTKDKGNLKEWDAIYINNRLI
jgi:FkbM family methyltransferase